MTKKWVMDWWVSVSGAPKEDLFPCWHVANEIAKPQVCINSNSSSIHCKKAATGNGNLQLEIEINKYSSSKKITRVVYYSSTITTRVVLEY